MINDDLLRKFDSIDDLPVSEEMLGAYIEGNVNPMELSRIELEMSEDSDLLSFVKELEYDSSSILDNLEKQILDPDYPHFLSDIQLPDIESGDYNHVLNDNYMVAACCPDDFFGDASPLFSEDLHNADELLKNNFSSDDSFGIVDQSLDIDSPEESDDMFNNDSVDV